MDSSESEAGRTEREEGGSALSPLDAQVYRELTDLLGEDHVQRLLAKLEGQLSGSFAALDPQGVDRSELAREAHALVSQAGMLGFLELGGACRDLEAECLSGGGGVAVLLERARLARDRALQEIDRLKHGMPPSGG